MPRVDYLGIHFVNVDTGWACGDLGTIIKTTDGGQSWNTLETNTTTPILKVNSFNGQTVVASGFNGIILRSTDRGENWIQITSGVTGDLWGLQMINDTLGWACGTANSLIKTTDGGQTWQTSATPGYTSDYWWIDFLDENYGFIAANGKVLRTTNAGNTWDIVQAGDNQALFSVDVIDSLHIAAAGYGGTGYRGKTVYSSDGGNTWITGGPTTYDPINCIKYVNPDTGYITMSEVGLWKTTDSGQSWILLDLPLSNIGEFDIQLFKQENIGYNAGSGLKIYKADGDLDVWHKAIINDDFVDVFFPTEQKGFVISSGPRGRVYRTFDSGEHWQLASGPSGYSLFFTDSLTGYLGSTAIWKTTDGGDNWYQTNSPNTYGEINKIVFINNQIGWYVAIGGVIYKTTDSGENWFQQLYRSGAGFSSISFVDSLYGWASLGGWKPYKTTDGGQYWVEQTGLDYYNTNDVYFTNVDTGFIINGFIGNNLYKTVDGGINWQPDPIIDAGYNFNCFPNKYHWILNGVHQRWETTNNGVTWNEITQDCPGFNKFQAPKEWIGYAVGGDGLILRYEDTTYVPVELIFFEGKPGNGKIFLTWQTATETNNYGYEIEKSIDNKNWVRIGFVSGQGTTTEPQSYSFIDSDISSEIQYYRLRQVDYNGSYNYSKIIIINSGLEIPSFYLFQNYPNPFNGRTIVTYAVPVRSLINISLYNIIGEKIAVLINAEKDEGIYKLTLDDSKLSSGIYFIRMETRTGYSSVIKIVQIK